jgi:phenylacetate-CoA ligase
MFDVTKYTYGIDAISKHLHTNLKTPETIKAQKRLLKKWNLRSHQLHSTTKQDLGITSEQQLKRISLLIDFAFSTHPYYHQLYKSVGYTKGDIVTWDDYHALPTISKQDIIQHFDMFCHNLAPTIDECYTSRTSGSSGQVLTAMFDHSMIDEDMMQCFRFYEQMLNRPRSPKEWLYQIYVAAPPFTSLNGEFPTFTVSNDCPPEIVLKHLGKIKPAILAGLPSYLIRLGELIDTPSKLKIKAINTNSESSTEIEREHISQMFGAPVYDEYSSVELGLIATQCHQHKYHIVEDNVRVDVLNPDKNGMGEIIATSLINSYMPFIRYRQGDVIRISENHNSCLCGSQFRALSSFMGRTDQFLVSSKIGKVPPDQIMSLYDRLLLTPEAGISEFQIVQTSMDDIHVRIVPKNKEEGPNLSSIQEFSEGLKRIFNNVDLNIIITEMDQLPENKSYKRRLIENQISDGAPAP